MADSPLINGHKFGWASISLGIDGIDSDSFTEVNHKWMSDRGKVRAKGTRVLGFTRGDDDVDGDITMLKDAYVKLLEYMKKKFGSIKKASFPITIQSSETGEDRIITEELLGCRLAGAEMAAKPGSDPLTVKIPLHILRYRINGIDPQE